MAIDNETSVEVVQQQIKISGIVKDATGEPVIGASVLEKAQKTASSLILMVIFLFQ